MIFFLCFPRGAHRHLLPTAPNTNGGLIENLLLLKKPHTRTWGTHLALLPSMDPLRHD